MSRPLATALLLLLVGAAAPRLPAGCGEDYRVVRGDTLSGIASRCRSTVAAIARANGIRDPDLILVGQRLAIPGGRVAVARRSDASRRPDSGIYRVARGDTLFSLARWSGTRLPALLAANPGIDAHRIEVGDPIRLPAGAVRPERARARERGGAVSAPEPRAQEPPAREPEERRTRGREPEVVAM